MRRIIFPLVVYALLSLPSCKEQTTESPVQVDQINNQLSPEERAGGVMTPEIMWKFRHLGKFALSPDGSSVIYTVTDIDLKSETDMTNIYRIPSEGGEAVQLTSDGGSSPQWFNGGNSIAYVHGGNLWTMNSDGTDKKEISGLTDFEIFSIAPDNNHIYFTRRVKMDQTANEKYGLPNANVRIIDELMYRHWDYWSDYSYSHIFVASFNNKSISDEKDIMEGDRFESPTSPYFDEDEITWSPDSRYIAYTSKRLTGLADTRSTNSDIFLYDIHSSEEKNITESNKGYDKYPVFSPDGSGIAYQSMERDGYESDLNRLFVYDMRDNTNRWITPGWEFDAGNTVWADNQNILFTCDYLGSRQIFKTSTIETGVDKLTEGAHDLGPADLQSGVLIAGIMSLSMAPEISHIDIVSGKMDQISNINNHIYDVIKMGNVEERYIVTSDNKDLQMWVIYPPDFDPSRKYPSILFCNGGPQSSLGQFWSYRWNFQMMAAKGYIVIAPNRRGNSGFGQEWKEQISGDYGGLNMQDYLDATDAMAKESFIDTERMAAVGASYGGYSVFYLAGIHSGRYKAFISHCGVFNLTSWYGTTDELWFPDKDIEGPYWNEPASYRFSPHLRVEEWDTPILIITGRNDFRIPYTQSLEAFHAAQVLEIPSRLLFFEDEDHFVTKPQNAVIWQNEFFNWLETYLKY